MVAPDSPAVKPSETLTVKSPATPSKQTPTKVSETKLENIERVPTENVVTVKSEAEKTFPNSTGFETVVENQIAESIESPPPETKSVEAQTFEPPTVEQTVFVEPDAPQTSEFREAPQDDEDKTPDKTAAPSVSPQYFQKTTEILEKGSDATPLEIQQILLQEVRQWAAETPDITEYAETEIVEAKQPTVKIVPAPTAEESIVVRENSALRGDENQGLEEQNLSLSIGTISIIVEDANQPTPTENVAVVRPNNENRGGETKRQFSSLRRHYL